MKNKIFAGVCSAFTLMLLGACGGGGGGNSEQSTPTTHSIGGNVSNLSSSGLVLSDGVDTVNVPANATSVVFPTKLTTGATYNVQIVSQPGGFSDICSLSNSSGTIGSTDISTLTVSCHAAVAAVTTFAGGADGIAIDGKGTAASFHLPFGISVDTKNNIYVADTDNNSIRKISAAGDVTTLAGCGVAGGGDGIGKVACFYFPNGVTVDTQGNVYVADTDSNLIRKITSTGLVSTLAGAGPNSSGSTDGIGAAARFTYPLALAADSSGNVYVADTGNNLIRKITPAGMVTTFAGNGGLGSTNGTGTAASFKSPNGIAVDTSGNIYVADTYNNLIRKVTANGVVTTLAGNGSSGRTNGISSEASFYHPTGVAVDSLGNVYVADSGNYLIRKISTAGIVTTLAGSGSYGNTDGIGTAASFSGQSSLAVDSSGNIFVTDGYNGLIRKITPQ